MFFLHVRVSGRIRCYWKALSWQPCTFLSGYTMKCISSRNTNLQRLSALAPNIIWALTNPRNKSKTPHPGVPAPPLGFSGRILIFLCKQLRTTQCWTKNPGTAEQQRADAIPWRSIDIFPTKELPIGSKGYYTMTKYICIAWNSS